MSALVQVTRGDIVESEHAGHAVVSDAEGRTVFEWGDPNFAAFPRSAVKAIQALPLIESGAADALGFGDCELAFACASHSGEPAHIDLARSMIERAGLDETCLECGGHWSLRQSALIEQARHYDRTPGPICNNCSGKHAGFVCTAAHLREDVGGYVNADHPVQQRIRQTMIDVTGAKHDKTNVAIDGCQIPTYAIPLSAMAKGFARMASGTLPTDRAAAAKRLFAACMAEPFFVAGTGRFCTDFITAGASSIFTKTGAEGVFCGAIPSLGLGIALKVADGTSRASELAFACIAQAFLRENRLEPFTKLPVTSWAGTSVGKIRPAPDFDKRLLAATTGSR